ncbi:MAG: hypothetical protein DCF22_02835 [Leptolyngbya sp.]|nr:MAG: hypothetical protein DCF22_02835 [Leptolyngbya sp.]
MPQSFDQCRGKRFQPFLSLNDRLKRHPVIFWGMIWMVIALPSGFAIGSLINPNSEGLQPVTAIAQNSDIKASDIKAIKAAQPASRSSTDSGQLPLWVFGAIAVACTGSCFILAQHIKPVEVEAFEAFEAGVEVSAEDTTPLCQSALEARSQPQIDSFKQPLKRLKPYEPTEALPYFVQTERSDHPQPAAAEWVVATQQFLDSPHLSTGNLAAPVSVTVIPAEESQPLDWGEARLADAMDLRRRYPLHFMANNNFQS